MSSSSTDVALPPSLAVHWPTLETLSSSLAACRVTSQRHHQHIAPLANAITPKVAGITAAVVAHHDQSTTRSVNRLLALCPRVPLYHHDTLQSLLIINDVTKRTDHLINLLLSSSSASISATHWFSSFGSNAGTDDRSLTAVLALVRYVSAALLSYDTSGLDDNNDLYRLVNRIIIYIINLPYLQWQNTNRRTSVDDFTRAFMLLVAELAGSGNTAIRDGIARAVSFLLTTACTTLMGAPTSLEEQATASSSDESKTVALAVPTIAPTIPATTSTASPIRYGDVSQPFVISITRGTILALADASSSLCSLATAHVILPHLINLANHRTDAIAPSASSVRASWCNGHVTAPTLRAIANLLNQFQYKLFPRRVIEQLFDLHFARPLLRLHREIRSSATVDALLAGLTLAVTAATTCESLQGKAVQHFKELLARAWDMKENHDDHSEPVTATPNDFKVEHGGVIDIINSTCLALTQLAARYTDHVGSICDSFQSILLTSRRLMRHAREKQLRMLITTSMAAIMRGELLRLSLVHIAPSASSTALVPVAAGSPSSSTTFGASHTRRIAFGLLSGGPFSTPMIGTPTNGIPAIAATMNGAIPHHHDASTPARTSIFTPPLPSSGSLTQGSGGLVRSWSGADLSSLREGMTHRERTPMGLAARLTAIINVPALTTLVLPQILHRLSDRSTQMHTVASSLTQIALQSNDGGEAYSSIISMMMQCYASDALSLVNNDGKDGSDVTMSKLANLSEMIASFMTLARSPIQHHGGGRADLMRRIARLFSQLCGDIQVRVDEMARTNNNPALATVESITTVIQRLCAPLLVPLSSLLLLKATAATAANTTASASTDAPPTPIPANDEGKMVSIKGFRRLWLCITAYSLLSPTTPSDITHAIERLARYSPVLVYPNSRISHLTKELDHALSRMKLNDATVVSIRRQLTKYGKFPATELNSLPAGEALYLLTMVQLESTRVRASVASVDDNNTSVVQATGHKRGRVAASVANGYYSTPYLALYEYMHNDGIIASALRPHRAAFAEIIASVIASVIFDQSVNSTVIATRSSRVAYQRRLLQEQYVQFLVVTSSSRYELDRKTAIGQLRTIVTAEPHLQWSTNVMATLLDLLHLVHSSLDDYQKLTRGTPTADTIRRSTGVQVASSRADKFHTLDLPSSRDTREVILRDLELMAKTWLTNARTLANDELVVLVDEYVNSLQRSSLSRRGVAATAAPHGAYHIGVALASAAVMDHKSDTHLSVMQNLSIKDRYLGDIEGKYASYQHFAIRTTAITQSSNTVPFGAVMATQLRRELTSYMDDYRQAITVLSLSTALSTEIAHAEREILRITASLSACVMNCAALLVWINSSVGRAHAAVIQRQELLHTMCQAVGVVFTSQVVASTICAWQWIMMTDASNELPLFVEIQALWQLTLERRVGIFTVDDTSVANGYTAYPTYTKDGLPSSTVLAPTSTHQNVAHRIDMADSVRAHSLLISYLSGWLKANDARARDCVARLCQMMIVSLPSSTPILSNHVTTFTTRLRLLRLAITVARSRWCTGYSGIIRDRVLASALNYFMCTHRWAAAHTPSSMLRLRNNIIKLCRALHLAEFSNDNGLGLPTPAVISSTPATLVAPTPKGMKPLLAALPAPAPAPAPVPHPAAVGPKGGLATASSSLTVTQPPVIATCNSVHEHDYDYQHNLNKKSHVAHGHDHEHSACDRVITVIGGNTTTGSGGHNAHSNGGNPVTIAQRRDLLLWVLYHELDRLAAWQHTTPQPSVLTGEDASFTCTRGLSTKEWRAHVTTAWNIDALLALRFIERFAHIKQLRAEFRELLVKAPHRAYHVPAASSYLATEAAATANAPELSHLMYWAPTSIVFAMRMLLPPLVDNTLIARYAVSSLRSHPVDRVLAYVPQIIQLMRFDRSGALRSFLVDQSRTSIVLSHQLVWACQAEMGNTDAHAVPGKDGKIVEKKDAFKEIVSGLSDDITSALGTAEKRFMTEEFAFFEKITALSGVLKPFEKPLRRAKLQELLAQMGDVPPGMYLPTNPTSQVVKIIPSSGRPMQSAARVPILVAFVVKETPVTLPDYSGGKETKALTATASGANTGEAKHMDDVARQLLTQEKKAVERTFTQACIFKVADDTRQDALALQITGVCRDMWRSIGLDLYVIPYRVLPNRSGSEGMIGGILECVPNAQTRDEIGKATGCALKDYFIGKFGREDSAPYQRAQRNFIISMAGYAVTSYILQVKDRHNGNIMVDHDGHMLHIDFGFLFDTSPARDMKFEKPGFKLTLEMVEVMGDQGKESPLYKWFVELVICGFLAVRSHMEDIMAMVEPMFHSSLPCFRPLSLPNLRARFFPDRDERGAAAAMMDVIEYAYDSFRTNTYDWIQLRQQNVYYWRGPTADDNDD